MMESVLFPMGDVLTNNAYSFKLNTVNAWTTYAQAQEPIANSKYVRNTQRDIMRIISYCFAIDWLDKNFSIKEYNTFYTFKI